MEINTKINYINMAVSIYDSNNIRIASNNCFDSLFNNNDKIKNFELFVFGNLPKNKKPKYALYNIDDKEYLVSFIMSEDNNCIVTLHDSCYLNDTIRKMRTSKNMEDEFYKMISAIYPDFVVIDKDGIIVEALYNFEEIYGISREEAIGKTIYEMEERKIFNPSVAIKAFKSGKQETMLQLTGANKYIMCTAIPIMDNSNEITKVISYTTDQTKYQTLKNECEKLTDMLKTYSDELDYLRSNNLNNFSKVIGVSDKIKNVTSLINKIAKFDTSVLFTGMTGVGKTMFARLTHAESSRKNGPFIEINCGAIPENLLESELFGYEKGAFTGANKEGKRGLIELANKGTLFLDEIGDLPLHMQVKLLKVIQEKNMIRVGGTESIQVDFRLISATSKDLNAKVKTGEFREELFYRINIITIYIPSLNERREDIVPLSMHFLEKCKDKYGLSKTLSNSAINCLTKYNWPGNIRELENTIERLVLTTSDYMITVEDIPDYIKLYAQDSSETIYEQNKTLKDILTEIEKKVITESYMKHKTTTGVAKELGISQPSASIKINQYIKKTN